MTTNANRTAYYYGGKKRRDMQTAGKKRRDMQTAGKKQTAGRKDTKMGGTRKKRRTYHRLRGW